NTSCPLSSASYPLHVMPPGNSSSLRFRESHKECKLEGCRFSICVRSPDKKNFSNRLRQGLLIFEYAGINLIGIEILERWMGGSQSGQILTDECGFGRILIPIQQVTACVCHMQNRDSGRVFLGQTLRRRICGPILQFYHFDDGGRKLPACKQTGS